MAIQIGSRREFFWDEYLIDMEKTTACFRVHEPVRKNIPIKLDKPWEGDGCDYFCTVYDDAKQVYRMYYNAWEMISDDKKTHTTQFVKVCCIESKDGLEWYRPNLGIVEFEGSKDNNIVITTALYPGLLSIDNFFVTIDTNKNPTVPGKYKAVMAFPEKNEEGKRENKLVSLRSDDGYHFDIIGTVTKEGMFDTLNTILWHEATQQYICYIRSFHNPVDKSDLAPEDGNWNAYVRDIRVLFSKDCITWTRPEHVQYNDVEDYPLYTNCVCAYPGAEHILIGLPTRYVERPAWTPNFDRLCGAEKRKERCKIHPRYGLTTTDCLFMSSRDGANWYRFDEAFMRPGPEFPKNWVYGSCYPAIGLISTPSDIEGADEEWSVYTDDNHWLGNYTDLVRNTIRKDGFVSMHADRDPVKLVTKSFIYDGTELDINFSTSARGYMMIKLVDDDGDAILSSCELFGDRVNRVVDFDGEVSALAGKSVHMEIEMKDADIYAFQFKA